MALYPLVLFLHSYVRWVVLLAALLALVRSLLARRRRFTFTLTDDRLHQLLVRSADLQLGLGLLLYLFLSPFSAAFLSDPRNALHQDDLRFFGLGHPITMILAVAVLHLGRRRLERKGEALRHRTVIVSTVIFLLLAGAAVPWASRPLLRTPAATFR